MDILIKIKAELFDLHIQKENLNRHIANKLRELNDLMKKEKEEKHDAK